MAFTTARCFVRRQGGGERERAVHSQEPQFYHSLAQGGTMEPVEAICSHRAPPRGD